MDVRTVAMARSAELRAAAAAAPSEEAKARFLARASALEGAIGSAFAGMLGLDPAHIIPALEELLDALKEGTA